MSACCPSNLIPFFDTPTTDIPYSDSMKALFGPEPKISLYYLDPDTGVWYTQNGPIGVGVSYDPITSILHIDHGGIFSGMVKLQ